ncbi:MAG: chromate transporter [Spirochaetaceae bacterium]|jgi:chromate transporter|nr:chromate transporter [Spirochaetaceae bacterium]
MNLFLVYAEFFKIGAFSVGGGLATLPFLYDIASRYDWLTRADIGNFLAIAQSSPGAVGVNMAAQTGYLAGGIPGAVLAPLGLITPAIIAILIVARIFTAFKENAAVKAVFGGLRPAAAGLIAAAGFGVIRLSLYAGVPGGIWYEGFRLKEMVLFAALFILVWKCKKHPILYIAAAGMAGIALGL